MNNNYSLAEFLNSTKMSPYQNAVNTSSNSLLKDLAKEEAYAKLISKDAPLYDSSLEVLPGMVGVTRRAIASTLPKNPYFTVYHGTSPANKKSIIENGIKTEFTGKEGTLTNKALNGTEANDLSKGLAFTTTSKWDAARYAASHDTKTGARIDSSSPAWDQIKKLGRQINSYVTDKGIVTMTLPNSAYRTEVLNPEAATLLSNISTKEIANKIPDKYKTLQDLPLGLSSTFSPYVAAAGFGKDKVFKMDIPSKYIKGAKDYVTPTSKEFIPYQETLIAKDALANKLYAADKNLDIVKKAAAHNLVNDSLRYAGDVKK